MLNKKLTFLIFTAIIALGLFKFGSLNLKKNPVCNNCNVIVIGIDSLRADHLGIYGYKRPTSPNIDNLAKDGIIFRKNFSQSINTTPSFMSILTSLYPTDHGILFVNPTIVGGEFVRINANINTLPEILKENNYKTKSMVSSDALMAEVGFDEGFDSYSNDTVQKQRKNLIRSIKENKNNKFFIFYHDNGVHLPYFAPKKYLNQFLTSRDTDKCPLFGSDVTEEYYLRKIDKNDPYHLQCLMDYYDSSIKYMDDFIGEMIRTLKSEKLLDNTIIVFLSDHGEEFMDHGALGHVQFYNEILHVPLIFYIPSLQNGKKIDSITRSIDIMPTILETLNIRSDNPKRGQSLLPFIIGNINNTELPVISILGHDKSIIWKNHKFIDQIDIQRMLENTNLEKKFDDFQKRNLDIKEIFIDQLTAVSKSPDSIILTQEFYDLENDPHEKTNTIESDLNMKKTLIEKYMKEVKPDNFAQTPYPLRLKDINSTIDKLKSLGY